MRRPMLDSLNIVYVGTDDIPEKVRNYIKEQLGVDHLIKTGYFEYPRKTYIIAPKNVVFCYLR